MFSDAEKLHIKLLNFEANTDTKSYKSDVQGCGEVLRSLVSQEEHSEELKDLVNRLEKGEITAQEALSHSWIANVGEIFGSEKKVMVAERLRLFQAQGKLIEAVQTYLAVHCADKDEIAAITETFRNLDTNGDGKLSRDELLQAYIELTSKEEAEDIVDYVIRNIDSDCNGYVNYTEYLKACLLYTSDAADE